ncbi:MAG: saccharopine dehydrogenase NADP-binding domain-containing protein [Deltaproteobacteria bacterium]|nr:saccharopine dehydrogenase NADP-binding domain-containing protein [Deltaproteobacteria bacterium]
MSTNKKAKRSASKKPAKRAAAKKGAANMSAARTRGTKSAPAKSSAGTTVAATPNAPPKKKTKLIVVAGGAGAMGRITVRDLVETAPANIEIAIADYNLDAAKQLAASFTSRPVRAIGLNIKDVKASAKALTGAFGVIGAVQHQLNVPLMQACLAAGAHYCDLGGLFHYTRKQLPLHERFAKAGLLAVLGVGAAPGIVNVLARALADEMDRVHEIHIKVGNIDRTPNRPSSALGTSYSLATILDEANHPAALFTKGQFTFVEPMSGVEEIDFGPPVGVRRPAYTIHSEVATLPLSFKDKGVREVSFRIAFSDELAERLRFLRALGASGEKPLSFKNATGKIQKVVPRDVLVALAARLPKVELSGTPDEYEVCRVVVKGTLKGRELTETMDLHCPGIPAWGFGVDVDTGCPPSIVMQMLARGSITARGVLPPEIAIPPKPFFKELKKRGMTVVKHKQTERVVSKAA